MPKLRAPFLVLLPALLLAACGLQGSPVSRHAGLPPILGTAPSPVLLRPVATATTLGLPGGGTLRAALTGQAADTVTVGLMPDGDGQVTIASGGRVLLRRGHVGAASILSFGRRHLPVLLLQDAFDLCGSGGCQTSAYTWSRVRRAFLPVPPPSVPVYLYRPDRRQFLQTLAPMPGGLFGFVAPGPVGVVLEARTYDVWQHTLAQSYSYAPGLSATGGWVAAGEARYAPSGREPGVAFSDPGQALLALLTARSLGFRAQVAQVSASPKDLPAILGNLRQTGTWQASLFAVLPAPEVQVTGTTAIATDRIAGLVGQGPRAKLEAYEVTAVLEKIGAAYLVQAAHLAPLAVKVRSASEVLAAIRASGRLLGELEKDGDPPLLVQAVGERWQVSLAGRGSMRDRPWIEIDALSGKVRGTN